MEGEKNIGRHELVKSQRYWLLATGIVVEIGFFVTLLAVDIFWESVKNISPKHARLSTKSVTKRAIATDSPATQKTAKYVSQATNINA